MSEPRIATSRTAFLPVRPSISIRTMVKATVTLLVAVGLATFAAGGTYAFWNSSATVVPVSTIKSGTAALAITTPLAMPTTPLYPGVTLYGSAVLTNSGDVALAPRLSSVTAPAANAFAASLSLAVGRAASVADCTAGTMIGSTAVAFGSNSAVPLGAPIPRATTGVVCVAVTLPASAPNGAQGLSANGFAFTLDGTQV